MPIDDPTSRQQRQYQRVLHTAEPTNNETTTIPNHSPRGLEAVWERPSMYIGDTHGVDCTISSMKSLIIPLTKHWLILLNIRCHHQYRQFDHRYGRRTLESVDIHPVEKKPACEVALTVLHAGGKEFILYKVSGRHLPAYLCVNAPSNGCPQKKSATATSTR